MNLVNQLHYKLLIKNAHNHLSNDPIFTHSDMANMLSICTGINSTTIFNDIENYKEEIIDLSDIIISVNIDKEEEDLS